MSYLRVCGVSVQIKGAPVLQNVSFSVGRGEVVGLEGTNGSGKTMAMRVAVGLVRPQMGEVEVDGRLMGRDLDFPPSVGVLIESPGLLGSYSALDNLRLVASVRHAVSDDDLCRALRRVGLDPTSRKRARRLSLGMRQRLGLAMALMEAPELLVLDEPTNALDERAQETLVGIVAEERARGAAVLLSSHDADFLRATCDRVYHMSEGRVLGCEEVAHEAA